MKTNTVRNTLFMVLASATLAYAQQSGFPCGTQDYNDRLRQQHPAEVQQAEQQLEAETQNLLLHGEGRSTSTYIIPVVFHIIHDYGTENISDAQVLDQVNILNRDYAKRNADTANIIPQFQSIASAIDIEFRLATIDPDGNCTNGIDRIFSKKTNQADDGSKLNPWPRNKYLNVWVVKSIGAQGVAGYAYYPSAVVGLGQNIDGVLILSTYIGSIGTGSVGTSRALTHEIGHYLNLAHPWGSTNSPGVACGDDGIPDTPKTKGWDHCPTPAQAKVCDTAIVENYQNYMDYSYCSIMFTHDQATAMHAALNTTVSDRNHLWTMANLIATGTSTTTGSVCVPKADFHANHPFVCEGGTIQFFDNSWNGTVSSRSWSFPGGTPATSTALSPTVTYNAEGSYPVTLTVTNSAGSNSITKTDFVTIGASYGEIAAPVVEGFETPNELANGWYVINNNNDGIYWHQTTAAAYTGTTSVVLDNFNNTRGEVDELISPQYDLRWLTNMTITFKMAFASQVMDTSLLRDKLRLLISTNCGQSWTPIMSKVGAQIASGGVVPNYFIPNSQQSWGSYSVNISNANAQSRVRFKFEFTSSTYGNELYLDDINITGMGVGIQEAGDNAVFFGLYPNPAQGNSNLQLVLNEKEHLKVVMTDLNGRVVKEIANQDFSEGEHVVPISTEGIAEGIYFVTVDDGTHRQVKKLAVSH